MVSTGTGFNGFNMFAYCNNNPVIYSDTTGNNLFTDIGNWFSDRKDDVCNFFNGAVSTVKNTYNFAVDFVSKIDFSAVPAAVVDNLSLDVGLGYGLGGSFEVNDYGCNVVFNGDIFAGELTSKGFEETFEVHGAAQIDLLVAEFGPYFDQVHSADCQCLNFLADLPCTGTYESGMMREKESLNIGMCGYLILGGRFEISFDPDGFWDTIYKGD